MSRTSGPASAPPPTPAPAPSPLPPTVPGTAPAFVPVFAPSLARLARLEVSRAALHAGLRAAVATVPGVLAAAATGRPELVWAALGGWLTSLADAGGAFRTRARAIAAFLAAAPLLAVVGGLVAGQRVLAVVLVAAVAAGGGLLRAAGDVGATLGVLLASVFSAALAMPGTRAQAAAHAVWLLAGGAWAAALALVVWPVRPYGPARQAAADVVRALAALARALRDAAAHPGPPGAGTPDAVAARFAELVRTRHAPVRGALEQARAVLAATRRTRLATSRRAEQMVLLVELSDELFAALVAAEDAVEGITLSVACDDAVREALGAVLAALPPALDGVAASIPSGRRAGRRPEALDALDHAVLSLWGSIEPDALGRDLPFGVPSPAAPLAGTRVRQAVALLEQAATLAESLAEASAALAEGRESRDREEVPAGAPTERALHGAALSRVLRALASPDALTVRHALRLGATVGVAQAIGGALHVQRAQWVTTTALLVLQPYAGSTWQRGRARALGTVAGAVLAALLAAVLDDRLAVAAVMFPLMVAAVAVRTADYALFTFFLTPIFVLLAEPALGDWRLAGVRIVDTAVGAALAMAASRLLWPSYEHRTLGDTLAEMLDGTRAYWRAAARVAGLAADAEAGSSAPEPPTLDVPRRRAGLAAGAADAAVERWLAEPRGPWRDAAALMAVLAQARRVNSACTGLAFVARAAGAGSATSADRVHAAALDALLDDMVDAARERRPPAPLAPALASGAAHPARVTAEHPAVSALAGPLARLARHAVALHGALSRLTNDASARDRAA